MITSSIAATILIALIISICAFTPTISANAEKEVRIADKAGDWGHPSPYLAYSRGPGYLRMHFISMLFVTHDIGVARKVSDRIAVLHDGRIVENAPAHRVISNPVHQYTKLLIGVAKGETDVVG